jgi:hypothetical protein
MANDPARDTLEMLIEINRLCTERSLDDHARLELFELAWLTTAGNIRNAALAMPGGFAVEQARQLGFLEKMTALVGSETPDLEGERLFQEGDLEGWMEHMRRLMDDAKGGQ